MKLRQKLAMVMAAAMVTSATPVITRAVIVDVVKESMTTDSEYNKYGYYQEEDGDIYPAQNQAINLQIRNNSSDLYPLQESHLPAIVEITSKDISFDENLFQETYKDLDGYILLYDTMLSSYDYKDPEPLNRKYPYALADNSKRNDRQLASDLTSGSEAGPGGSDDSSGKDMYPHRLFTIDEDGNYTSYVSMEYAGIRTNYKNYLNSGDEIYLFGLASKDKNDDIDTTDTGERVFLNMIKDPSGDKEHSSSTRDKLVINDGEPKPIAIYLEDPNKEWDVYDQFGEDVLSGQSTGTRAYIKEYTLYRDQYGDAKTLEMAIYNRLGTNAVTQRMYVPLAFRVTGPKPSIRLHDETGYFTIGWDVALSSNTTISEHSVDIHDKDLGHLSIDGKGNLGSFEIEETLMFVFNGEFTATNDRSNDEIREDLEAAKDGRTYHIQLKNSKLAFDGLSEGDRYWDLKPDPANNEPGREGALAQYIQLTGGFRGYEDYIQVEVLGVQDEELVIRIIDESLHSEKTRNYEGGFEFVNLPIEISSRHDELKEGDLEMIVTEVDNVHFENNGQVDDVDFSNARSADETFTIAKINSDDVLISIDEEAELVAGQTTDKIEITLRELVGGSINLRDEFYLRFDNAYVVTNEDDDIDIEFEFDSESIDNVDANVLLKDGDEYILDLDNLYDACEGTYFEEDDEEAWYEILESLTFELELGADADADAGNITLTIESDNLADEEVTFVVGNVTRPFVIEAEPIYLDIGLKEQRTGNIIIKETKEEMLLDGHEIIIGLEDQHIVDAEVNFDANSGIDADISIKDGLIILTIEEESDDVPGQIIVSDLEFDIWAGTPRGEYNLFISGDALDHANKTYNDMEDDAKDQRYDSDEMVEYIEDETTSVKIADYLTVGTGENPEVEKTQIKTIVNFRSGSTTVNGTRVAMTSRPYITPTGWSMIGVRDLALFFGIPEEQISFGHDENNVMTVTIRNGKIAEAGSTLVTVKHGSKILTVNGNPVIMGEAMTIGSDNRAYAPIRPIAEALGLTVSWDGINSIATFSN
ncbi:copper amine oxidase N-terminal domain-containing protein [Candidatus Epulonipiscium viviparus]|uniref:copper amine oxidase N-terminal domain-containing protein n=1 Tax=Candidatus Epulonipiscium viviparus TaxID=420336 RepID=UPI00016BFCBA|nr:copper amine oxidase N-terminal domain-containing protein [Candidatus Epulopiscium viviparus]